MESDDYTAASGKVSESGQSTVVTSEGRENATQRSDLGGRRAAEMTIEDSSGNKNTTRLREGLVSEPNITRFNLARTDENRHGDRQGLTSSPAENTHFVRWSEIKASSIRLTNQTFTQTRSIYIT